MGLYRSDLGKRCSFRKYKGPEGGVCDVTETWMAMTQVGCRIVNCISVAMTHLFLVLLYNLWLQRQNQMRRSDPKAQGFYLWRLNHALHDFMWSLKKEKKWKTHAGLTIRRTQKAACFDKYEPYYEWHITFFLIQMLLVCHPSQAKMCTWALMCLITKLCFLLLLLAFYWHCRPVD